MVAEKITESERQGFTNVSTNINIQHPLKTDQQNHTHQYTQLIVVTLNNLYKMLERLLSNLPRGVCSTLHAVGDEVAVCECVMVHLYAAIVKLPQETAFSAAVVVRFLRLRSTGHGH